jgi:hypothetical protein
MVRAVRLLEQPLVAAPVLMSTSVGRARHNRATRGSPTRTGAPTMARASTLQSLGCGSKYEPAFLVARPADPRPRTLPSGVRPTLSSSGEASQGVLTAPAQGRLR